MANAGFSITSPGLAHLGSGMARTDIGLVAREAAVAAAQTLVAPMRTAITAAGGGAALRREVQVHDGHLNALVMREPGRRQDVIVGVSGESPQADEAEALEWGSLEQAPGAWVRTTAAARGHEAMVRWSSELTQRMDRAVRR